MKNKLFLLILVTLLSACASQKNENRYVVKVGGDETSYLKDVNACPKVHIRRNDATIVQKEGEIKVFEIIASGYSGQCYFNENIKKERAVIYPEFKIIRLEDTDITDIHFSYYLETAEGPETYLGKKTYFAEVSIPKGTRELYYKAKPSELSIPLYGKSDLDVYFGLNEDATELQFKK